MRTAPTLRVVEGAVNSSGVVSLSGTGDWTAVRTGLGTYVVRFPPFRGVPIITVGGATYAIYGLVTLLADSMTVQAWNVTTGAGADAGFHFRAEGRAP